MTITDKVYQSLRKIPKGRVITYKKLAVMSGVRSPRVVGSILHRNPDQQLNPCHRVVNNKGQLAKNFAFGGIKAQKKLLQNEGVMVKDGKVNLSSYLWESGLIND